jgi:hypothetical protein
VREKPGQSIQKLIEEILGEVNVTSEQSVNRLEMGWDGVPPSEEDLIMGRVTGKIISRNLAVPIPSLPPE